MGGSQSGTKQIAPTPPSAKDTPEASSSSISTNPSLTSSSSLTHLPPSSSWGGPLKIPDYFRGILADRAAHGDCDRNKGDDDRRKTDAGTLQRYASHTDLSQLSSTGLTLASSALSVPGPGSALGHLLRTPSSSTSSIPAKVVNKISFTPRVSLLKHQSTYVNTNSRILCSASCPSDSRIISKHRTALRLTESGQITIVCLFCPRPPCSRCFCCLAMFCLHFSVSRSLRRASQWPRWVCPASSRPRAGGSSPPTTGWSSWITSRRRRFLEDTPSLIKSSSWTRKL